MERTFDYTDDEKLLNAILNDSNQLIQVSDVETFSMMYANEPARIYTGHADQPYEGEHCYKYMMGLDEKCPFCPMHHMKDSDTEETEVDNGEQVFAVKTKIIDWQGKKCFIEYAWDITKLRRSQEIFESQMHNLIQSVPDAQGIFHLDITEDKCLSINGASTSVDGMERDTDVDTLVKMVGAFVPDEEGKTAFYETFCREALIRAYNKGTVEINKETDSYFDDGSIRSARITARLLMNPTTDHLECIIYGLDITEEKREKLEYEAHMREQLEIFNGLSRDYLNVYLVDAAENVAKILKLEGYVTEGMDKNSQSPLPYYELCRKYVEKRVHPLDQNMMLEAMKIETVLDKLSADSEYTGSYRVLIDGETHYYQFKYMRLESSRHIIVGFQNIDGIMAEEKRQQKILSDALIAAEHSNRAKTTFLNSMSHDIRTPLNAIVGCTALAASHIDNKAEVQRYLSKITVSSNHLLSLINDVLDMSHIESGTVKIDESPVHLPDILEDLRKIIQTSVSAKQLDLNIETYDIVHEDIISDKLRLTQVLLNILSNAVKFTKTGGQIQLLVKELADAPDGFASFEFRIRDNGIGISKEFIGHIFEDFTREQTSTISGIQGSGLGMSIAKNIVDLMGGDIKVESEPGSGSEFTVLLKFKINGEAVSYETIPELKGLRALVADDDFNTCASVTKMLDSIGMRSEWTTTGKEAVLRTQLAVERHDEFNVYIIDWLMPDMNGIETVRRIRKIVGDSTPIIILTAYDWSEVEAEARDAGVVAFCSKPLFMSELRDVLMKPFRVSEESKPEEAEKGEFNGKKILLVEDNELNQEIAVEILQEAGFIMDTAENGLVAVERMKKAKPGDYDLILMDIQMPVMDGYEATHLIRGLADPALSRIPIIAMTANAFDQDKQKSQDAGMNGYVAKPIDIPKMMETLREILD